MAEDKGIKVRAYYDNFAQNYDNFYEKIQFQKYQYVYNHVGKMKINNCIDLGGGTGLFSKFMEKDILTLDISFKMLSKGKKLGYISQAIQGDMSALPIRSKVFESIVSFTAIQNTANPHSAFLQIKRIAVEKSMLLISALEKVISEEEMRIYAFNIFCDLRMIKLPIEDIAIYNF